MFRRRPARSVSRSLALIEPLEDRRLLSTVLAAAAAVPLRYAVELRATASHSTIVNVAAKTSGPPTMHTLDDGGDDSGDDGGDSSGDGGDSGDSSDGGESSGDSGGDTGSSDAGESTGDTGATGDAGTGADDGGEAGATPVGDGSADAGEAGGSTVDSNPTDTSTPTDNSGDAGAGTTDNTGDGSASADGSTPAPDDGGTDDTGTDTGTDTGVLYPTGYPYGDDLYDDNGGGTVVVGPSTPYPPAFGGTLTVRLPAHPVAGDAGVAKVVVFNTGGPAIGQAEIAIGVTPDGSPADAVRVADQTVPVRLGSDRVAVYRVPFKLPTTLPAGTYRFLALIDAGDAFGETANSNNLAFGPSVTIGAAPAPDVSVTAASAPHTVRAGHLATVAIHLQETSPVPDSGPMTVAVTAESTDSTTIPLATVTHQMRLGRNGGATVRVQLPTAALSAGQYQLTVRLTPASAADVDAADKSAVTMFTVVG